MLRLGPVQPEGREPDDPAALASALHDLYADRDLNDRLSQRGFDGVRAHYDIERSTDRLMDVYTEVTGNAGLQPGAA